MPKIQSVGISKPSQIEKPVRGMCATMCGMCNIIIYLVRCICVFMSQPNKMLTDFLTEMGELGKFSPNCVSGNKIFLY